MILYLIWFIFVIIINKLASIYAKYRADSYLSNPYQPLPDIIHQKLPIINLHTPDYLLVVVLLYTIFVSFYSKNIELYIELYTQLNTLLCT